MPRLLGVLLVASALLTISAVPTTQAQSGCQVQSAEPDPTCTQGVVFPGATVAQICTPGYATRARGVSVDEKQEVYADYGLSYPQAAGAYEVDHLIPLELGGSNDIANLWPEAASPAPGFQEKDGLEDWLHDQVCAGAIALADAQAEIATDWIGVWQAAGAPEATHSADNTGDSGTTLTQASSNGHTFYASMIGSTIYCDTDPLWKNLSPRYLMSFPSLEAAAAALPGYHLHQPC